MYANFDDLDKSNPVYGIIKGSLRGMRSVCLIGYDDTMQTAAGNGAFKFINSWEQIGDLMDTDISHMTCLSNGIYKDLSSLTIMRIQWNQIW